jgi:hypothetical protein
MQGGNSTGSDDQLPERNRIPAVTLLRGISSTDANASALVPPDNATVADESNIVQAVNDTVLWSDLSGSAAVEEPMATFFRNVPNYGFFLDPRAIFDQATGQFVVSAGTEDGSSTNAHVLLGISNDGNPNDGWNTYAYQYSPDAAVSDVSNLDQPTLAADGSTFFLAASVSNEQLELIVPQDGKGTPIQLDLGSNNQAGIYKQAALPGRGDYALAQNNGTLTLRHITTSGLVDAGSSVVLGTIGPDGTLSETNGEQYLATGGETTPLDAGDTRIYSVTTRVNGIMWATFETTPSSGPDAGTPNVHWMELNVSDPSELAVINQQTISGSVLGSGVGTADGSIAVNRAGDVILNFVASGPDMTPTDYFEYKTVGASTFSSPIEWASSVGPYLQPGATFFGPEIASRWGDYSSAVADPNNPHGFYISNEISAGHGTGDWSTPIAHVVIPDGAVA